MKTILILLFFSLITFSLQEDNDLIVNWLREHGNPIKPVDSNETDEDLLFLSELEKGNRILSIGEESHGIGEFAEIKHRIFKYLALHHNYKIFAIEQDFCKVEPLNRYVLSGEGDPKIILSTFIRSYSNQETLRMIEWMRLYNSKAQSEGQKLKIFGFDCQSSVYILNRLKEVFINEPHISSLLDAVQLTEKRKYYGKTIGQNDLVRIQNAISDYQKPNQYSAYTHQLLKMLQYSKEISEGESINRDYYMAQICSWILRSEGSDSRMVLSAHNGHTGYIKVRYVKKDTTVGTLGYHLKEGFGDQLYTVGIDFNRGSFWATNIRPDDTIITKEYTLPNAPEHSLPGIFSRTGNDVFFLDFKKIYSNDSILEWFSKPRSMRSVFGSHSDHVRNESAMAARKPLEIFDGLIFFNEVKPSGLLIK